MKQSALVRRDPAMAALMGAMPKGSDFGSDFGDDFGDDEFGDEFGEAAMGGDEFGDDDFGDDFGAATAVRRPAPAAMAKAYVTMKKRNARRAKRHLLLDPNAGSELKIERYSFSVPITNPATSAAPILGTASSLSGTNTPDTQFKPSRVTINVMTPALVLVSEIKVGNVSGTVGGIGDAIEYNANGMGVGMSLPRMTPSTKASFLGAITTFVPPGFAPGASYTLVMSFKGASTVAPTG